MTDTVLVDNSVEKVSTEQELKDALANDSVKTIQLKDTIRLSSMLDITRSGVTLDLNSHELTAADNFTGSYGNDSHLVNVSGNNVTIKNGTLKTNSKNKHVLNVWKAPGETGLVNVTLDHSASETGAPLVVNNSHVCMVGDMKIITGSGSWYAVNVDNKYGPAALSFADATVTFSGPQNQGIVLDSSDPGIGIIAIHFMNNTRINAPSNTFKVIDRNPGITDDEIMIQGAELAGLVKNSDGSYVLAPTPTPDPAPEEKPDNRPSTPSDDDDDDDDDRDSSSSASKPSTGDKVVTKGETTTVTTGVSSLVKDETLSAKVSESVMNDAVDTALKTAAKKGTDPVVEIQLDSSKDVEAMSVTLTTKSLEKLANTDGAQLVLRSPAASVSFDAEALQAIVAQAGTNVTLSVAPVATDKLSAAQKASVGNDLVFELLLVSNGKYVTDFKDGQATVTLPYVLRSGETAENLVVYYLDDQGVLHACDTRYDAVNQCVIFTTPHFSKYVVGQAAGASASSDKENPSTGGRSMTSALAAAALSLGGVFLLGRKKR